MAFVFGINARSRDQEWSKHAPLNIRLVHSKPKPDPIDADLRELYEQAANAYWDAIMLTHGDYGIACEVARDMIGTMTKDDDFKHILDERMPSGLET